MTVTPLDVAGNSSKFLVVAKQGEFKLALSRTLRTIVWELGDEATELAAAQELAEAVVSRHDPATPFRELYVFAEHNTLPTLTDTVSRIRKYGAQ